VELFDKEELFDTVKLKTICEIRTGYQGKKEEGNMYKLINPTDLSNDGLISLENTKTFGEKEINPKFILKKQEILFKAKSSYNAVTVFKGNNQNLVPSVHFFILNIKDKLKKEINPEYISWYLGEEKAQKHFKKLATGMAMPIVRKSDLEDLEVNIPSIEVQDKVAQVQQLFLKEKQLLEELIFIKEKQIKSILSKLAN